MQTDDRDDISESALTDKLKKASGANYDLGSNAGGGYKTQAGGIQANARARYQQLEKASNIGPVVFDKGPLREGVTPMDLGGRAMVAPPTEGKKNVVVRDEAAKSKTAGTSAAGAAARMEFERVRKIEAEAKAKADAEAKVKADADAKAKAEADAKAKAEADAKAAEAAKAVEEEEEEQVEIAPPPPPPPPADAPPPAPPKPEPTLPPKPKFKHAETLEETIDEADRAKEKPPSNRIRKARAVAQASKDDEIVDAPAVPVPPKMPSRTSAFGSPTAAPAPTATPASLAAFSSPSAGLLNQQASAPAPPPPPSSDSGDPLAGYGETVVVLFTSMSRDQLATVATRKVVTQLQGFGMPYVELDGTDPNNKAVRTALWSKAGASPGTYPIIYVGSTGFTCKGDEVQDLIDDGTLGKMFATIQAGGGGGGGTQSQSRRRRLRW